MNQTGNQSEQDQSEHDLPGYEGPASALTAQDRARIDYWTRQCATLPPMTDEEISSVAGVLRRIDARRAARNADPSFPRSRPTGAD